MSAAVIALGSAIIGAIVGAYLQKRWTPDPSAEIARLRDQVAAFQERVEALEQERAESEQFVLAMSLTQAVPQSYIMLLRNDSDNEVAIESVNLMRGEVELSTPSRPGPSEDWTIGPHSAKQISWAPQPDPVFTLMTMEPTLDPGITTPIKLVVVRRIRGKRKPLSREQLVTVDYIDHRMTPFGPSAR